MLKYERTITDEEQKILEHDILDIKDWIDKAIEGKINKCACRAASIYKAQATEAKLEVIPTSDVVCALELFKTDGYESRVQRETSLKGE